MIRINDDEFVIGTTGGLYKIDLNNMEKNEHGTYTPKKDKIKEGWYESVKKAPNDTFYVAIQEDESIEFYDCKTHRLIFGIHIGAVAC